MKKRNGIALRLISILVSLSILLILIMACDSDRETWPEPSSGTSRTEVNSTSAASPTSETGSEINEWIIDAGRITETGDPSLWPGNIHTDQSVWSGLAEDEHFIVASQGLEVWFDKNTGSPVLLQRDGARLELGGLLIDVGIDGSYLMNTLLFSDFSRLATYELPEIRKTGIQESGYELNRLEKSDTGVIVALQNDNTRLELSYYLHPDGLQCNVDIINIGREKQWINGVLFEIDSMRLNPETEMLFPGNIPAGRKKLSDQIVNRITQAGLVTPVVMIDSEGSPFNILFLNDQEKWRTGFSLSGENRLSVLELSATEAYLPAGESLRVGDLFIQFAEPADPFASLREFYLDNGWGPAQGGITDGPLYSAHPAGTMDSGFNHGKDFFSYADDLEALVDIGIEHIWLLPVFEHKGRTDVYNPVDMAIIDDKYGGEEGAVYFGEKAAELGLNVLYDYVPHGPEPGTQLAQDHPEWCAVDRDGNLQIEWDSVSFDMADPDYQQYLYDLVRSQAPKFNLSGARIDCGMGGLPNWEPAPGNRPSNSNMAGGIAVARVIREAFVDSGVKPLILSENFYPIPFYWPHSDLFYDMPFYRMLYTLNRAGLDDQDYAAHIVEYLDAEVRSKPEGVLHMRFLGNHDTVSWVFDEKRPQLIYGTEKARALWSLLSFIDGIPMLYQGAEDPMLYGMGYPEANREFFTAAFSARRQWLGSHMAIRYDLTPDPMIALRRFDETNERLVLVNLSDESSSRYLAQIMANVGLQGKYLIEPVYGDAEMQDGSVVLPPYTSAIFVLQPVPEK